LEILGYFSAIFVGLTLGLIGGGGSILTVPILVYLMGVTPVNATAYSLFIVGLTSLIGASAYMKKKLVNFMAAVVFAIPAFSAVFVARMFIVPAIPDQIWDLGFIVITKDLFIMVLFAVLMFFSSYFMIKDKRVEVETQKIEFNYPMIIMEGILVGTLTGLVGAGGGFLIIPALVLLAKLPMKMAVGTSLLIIAVNSLIGFMGDIGAHRIIDWKLLSIFSVMAVAGIIAGSILSKYISGAKLKPAFGWFVMIMSIYILGKELIFH